MPQANAAPSQAEGARPAPRTQRLRISPGCHGLPANDPRDIFQISALCERSNAGDAQASYTLGRMYGSGGGVPQDPTLALSFLRLAEQQGHGGARAQITALESGRTLAKPTSMAPLAERPATPEQGRRRAIATEPFTSSECRGLPVYDPRFVLTLVDLCERAQRGDADALFTLGSLLDAGRQMPRNEAQAVRIFRLSAQLGSRPARLRLASMGYTL